MRSMIALMLVLLFCAAPAPAAAQLGKLKEKAKERIDRRTDQALDKVLDRIECRVDDSACIQKAEQQGKAIRITDADGNVVEDRPAQAAGQKPGEGAWANFDFVPGERVLFSEDYSNDRVGNFPKRLDLAVGTMEVVESAGKRWLRGVSSTVFTINLPEVLPERFTIEFDLLLTDYANGAVTLLTEFQEGTAPTDFSDGMCMECYAQGAYVRAAHAVELRVSSAEEESRRLGGAAAIEDDAPHRIRIHADGKYVKVYVDERRVVNVPNASISRTDRIHVFADVHPDLPLLLGPISINAGGREMYDALVANGRVATQGIYFDTGSDRIRPESSGTLKQIADMLQQHADLKLTIEGHTDNVGNPAANMTLSEKRAAAVKAALVGSYGIDGGRLETTGLGDTTPAAPNTTAEGRQSNRRVELVKL